MTQGELPAISTNVSMSMRISDVVKPWSDRLPDHKAVVDPNGSWTYRELEGIISRMRTGSAVPECELVIES